MSEQRQELIEQLTHLLEQGDVTAIKDQVEHIKTQFYRKNDEEASPSQEPDEQEEQFKELLGRYKTLRAESAAKTAKEQAENLSRKQAILSAMKALAESETDAVMSNLPRMRELQAEWKTIGAVPVEKVQEIRKAYQQYQEQFYDMVKINIELRDLDFKKNLELKTLLCEAAERLQNNENIVEASRALQQLHDEWAEIGPVAREQREAIWERFKTASSIINKKHQAYFDELHAKEQDNLARKQAIIDQLKELNEALRVKSEEGKAKSRDWEEATEKVQTLQAEWRTIGFAPKKQNQSIYDEYRAECDAFFHAKTAFYKGVRDTFTENMKRKQALIDQAVALNTEREGGEWTKNDWDAAADKIRALQAEWKTIGIVPRKHSDNLWKQFTEACDAFFNARREQAEKARSERQEARERAAGNHLPASGQALYRLRDNLIQEIKVAENNILFFSGKSKTANKLVEDMQRKIDKLKAQLDEVKAKIKAADEE